MDITRFAMKLFIYTGYVCINGHTAGLKKKKPTLPYPEANTQLLLFCTFLRILMVSDKMIPF